MGGWLLSFRAPTVSTGDAEIPVPVGCTSDYQSCHDGHRSVDCFFVCAADDSIADCLELLRADGVLFHLVLVRGVVHLDDPADRGKREVREELERTEEEER